MGQEEILRVEGLELVDAVKKAGKATRLCVLCKYQGTYVLLLDKELLLFHHVLKCGEQRKQWHSVAQLLRLIQY